MLGSAHGVVVDFAELSDAGRNPAKQVNEDAAGYAETPFGHLAVVCDGMGGHSAGREASQAAIRAVIERARGAQPGTPPGLVLRQAIEQAGRAVYAVGGNAPPELRPGSTCVALLIHASGCEVAHAGDSRAYLVRQGRIERLTRDHSMVQQLVDSGMLTPEQAHTHPEANKITRALGIAPDTEVELRNDLLTLAPGDTLILCTDGLTDLVSDPEILDLVQRRIGNGTAVVCQDLVALSNSRGGYDNITVLLLHVVEVPNVTLATGATMIDPGRGATGTLVPSQPRNRTVADDGRPAPTLFDDGVGMNRSPGPTQPGIVVAESSDRATQPGPSLPSVPSFRENDPPPVMTGRPISSTRAIWMLFGLLLIAALFAALAWGAVKLLHRNRERADEVVPPPSAAPRPSAVAVEPSAIVPIPSASAAPSSSAPKPDAPTDGGISG